MTPPRIAVTVAYAAPGVEALLVVTLPAGATVNDAIAQSGIAATLALDLTQLQFAIFGQRAKGETPLANGDRVELTRPLIADPRRARRKRAAERSRPGSDPGARDRG
jgi:putative ubiquitin-RnfH superfamily antitoxin RatB of RatAB toxin-antitoxin module